MLGALVLHEGQVEPTALDREVLEVLGKQLGTGLANVQLYAELRASSARGDALRRMTSAATSGSELSAIIPAFAAELALLQPFDRLACGFVNETGDYLEMVSHPEGTSWGLGGVLPVVGSGPGFVALNNRSVLQKDLVHEHRYLEDMRLLEEGLRSYALFPLSSRERAIGVLAIGSSQTGVFDEATLARLQPLADAVALALENVRLFQKTRELSITDEVTPLHNFRYFHQALERELKLVNRYGGALSLLFIDLDRFKPINDTYGHLRGSRTLREVGFLVRAGVRETDIPARYGGDEFVVILPQTDAESARILAEKLRRLVEGHTFLQEEGINARLGVSLGLATYPVEANTKEGLIRLADKRMYEDKESRRTGR
jgi:diguanylate cyclase (GGDEF)-like protein